MADTVPPALSAAEWKIGSYAPQSPGIDSIYRMPNDPTLYLTVTVNCENDDSAPTMVDAEPTMVDVALSGADLPATIALANDLLHEGHPNKITRADVELVLNAMVPEDWDDMGISERPEDRERRESLAAKLAALLPPEE